MQQHILYKHETNKTWKCSQCDFAHNLKKGLDGHMRSVHADESSLKVCHICGYKTTTNQNMRVHIEAKHEKIRNYSCTHCDVTFYGKYQMNQHIRG